MTEYVIVSEDELKIKKGELLLSPAKMQEILEYRDVFILFLNKAINTIQAQLGSCTLRGKENEAYIAIDTITKLIKDLNGCEVVYKKWMDQREKKEENKDENR